MLREHVIAAQAYQSGLGQWFGRRLLDVILLLSASSGMQDAARADYVKSMHEYLDAVSNLVDPFAKQRPGKPHAALSKRQATDEDRTQYLGLMAAGLRNANKQGFASLKELRQAMEALKETLTDINGATGNW